MKEVILYGKPSYPYEIVKNSLLNSISKAKLDLRLREIQDISMFLDNRLQTIPAVQFQDQIKHLSNQDLIAFVHEVNQWILEEENYGALQKIIVPIDYSQTAENALIFAKAYSNDLNGVIKIVHVHQSTQKSNQKAYSRRDIRKEKQKFEKHLAQLNKTWLGEMEEVVLMEGHFKVGRVKDELQQISGESNDELIILGTKCDSNTSNQWLGSVAKEMIDESDSTLLIVPPLAEYQGFKNVLIHSGEEDLDIQLYDKLVNLIRHNQANIHLVQMKEKESLGNAPWFSYWYNSPYFDKVSLKSISPSQGVSELEHIIKSQKIDLIVSGKKQKDLLKEVVDYGNSALAVFSTLPVLRIKLS